MFLWPREMAMFSFCPHCGKSIDQEQRAGQTIVCINCRKPIGAVLKDTAPVVVDQAAELIRTGVAARCPLCQQMVELRGQAFAPHFTAGVRKLCLQSGKPSASAAPTPQPPAGGKDLSAFMTRESIRLVSCRRGAEPRIEEVTLQYLDKKDRVRLQIEALRDILGPDFRMRDYPATLGRTGLAVWSSEVACVVGSSRADGGYQSLHDAEIAAVLEDLRRTGASFFVGVS
jgi:hypothetical protein